MKAYHIYIVTNKVNSVIYIGVTSNLKRRIFEHKNKLIAGFSKKYNLTKLVYVAQFHDIFEAISYEKKLKKYSRSKKNTIIEEFNKNWNEIIL